MSRINGQQFLKLSADARAFAQTVWLIEQEIVRLGVAGTDSTRVGGRGWRSHDVWEALKTASHFNLGIALEPKLKCILALQEGRRRGHHLTVLHDALGRGVQSQLEDSFRRTWGANGCTLVAYVNSATPEPPDCPLDRPLGRLRDFLDYFDQEMGLWTKRYAWEKASETVWRHYLDDVGTCLEFLDSINLIATDLARAEGPDQVTAPSCRAASTKKAVAVTLLDGRQDQHRPDHPHHAAPRHQQRLRPHARGGVDPVGGGVLSG